MSQSKFDALGGYQVVCFCFEIYGSKILPQTLHQRERNRMLHGGIGNEQGELATLYESRHQKSVFRSEGHGIKDASCYIDSRPPNRESCRIQVSNAAIGLKQVGLQHSQPQLFRPANHANAVTLEMKLKIVMLGKFRCGFRQSNQAVGLKSAISVREEQNRAFRSLDASISCHRNSGMILPQDRERIAIAPAADKLRGNLATPVIYDDCFKIYCIFLLVQRSKALIERCPILVDGYDDADERMLGGMSAVSSHACSQRNSFRVSIVKGSLSGTLCQHACSLRGR
jgi:hypothetical protein